MLNLRKRLDSFLDWCWGTKFEKEFPIKTPSDHLPRSVIRKYDALREAMLEDNEPEVNRIQSILGKSGYPVPRTFIEASRLHEEYEAKYGSQN